MAQRYHPAASRISRICVVAGFEKVDKGCGRHRTMLCGKAVQEVIIAHLLEA